MIPVLPRKRTEYDLTKLSGIEPSSCVLRSRAPCALYHMNKRFSSLRKMTIAIHIVVVSTSATALAFLERLLFGPWCVYLTFFNVSVVTPHGLPDTAGRQFLPQRSHFSPAYLSLLSLPTWVNVVYGDVTAIDRQEKHVCVNGAATLPYDYLFFFNEEVFLKPDCQLPKGREGHASREDGEDMASELQNVFYVNCETDAANMLVAVTSITSQLHEYNILVYGHNIEAFCCVKALVESGIPGRCVSFVEPLESPSVNCFNDRAVYEAMLEELLREGVQVFSGCYFHHWVIHSHEPLVTHVAFEAHTHCLYLTCAAVLYYGNKDVSDELFSVLNDASLVYDGRLVINTQFQTNDPHILAAGPLTKYARRLFADKFNHCLYNQVEVGTKVADSMMQQWDPMRTEEQVEDSVQLPPVFTKPVVVHCTLPGGVNYLHVRRPGVSVPAAVSTGKDSNKCLKTSDSIY